MSLTEANEVEMAFAILMQISGHEGTDTQFTFMRTCSGTGNL